MILLAQTDMLNVSHDVHLARLLCFVLELFLANTCLHAFKWVIQTSGQTFGLRLASKWRRQQANKSRLISTLKWII